jgi:hypothetical protein
LQYPVYAGSEIEREGRARRGVKSNQTIAAKPGRQRKVIVDTIGYPVTHTEGRGGEEES